MKNNLFRLSVAALTSACFVNAHAVTYKDASPTASRFSVQLTALYLQPNANNLNYAVYTQPLPLTRSNWTQVTLKPGFTPAFALGLQYEFENSSNKTNLDWLYLSTNDSTSIQRGGGISSVAPPYYFGPLAQALSGSSANSQAKFIVNNINLTFGHLFNIDRNITVDLFGGISTAYLKENVISGYSGVDSNDAPYSITSINTSKFTGIGPRIGVNTTYFIKEHFGLSVRFGGSLLAGSQNTDSDFDSFGAGNTTTARTTLANQTLNKIVPEIDGKLELSYVLPMNGNNSVLSFAVGYLFTDYINGITEVVPTSLVPGAFNGGSIAIETSAQNQSDLSLNGPYVNVTWKI